jgi:hypothetical protein
MSVAEILRRIAVSGKLKCPSFRVYAPCRTGNQTGCDATQSCNP